jgi:hypothetical protein
MRQICARERSESLLPPIATTTTVTSSAVAAPRVESALESNSVPPLSDTAFTSVGHSGPVHSATCSHPTITHHPLEETGETDRIHSISVPPAVSTNSIGPIVSADFDINNSVKVVMAAISVSVPMLKTFSYGSAVHSPLSPSKETSEVPPSLELSGSACGAAGASASSDSDCDDMPPPPAPLQLVRQSGYYKASTSRAVGAALAFGLAAAAAEVAAAPVSAVAPDSPRLHGESDSESSEPASPSAASAALKPLALLSN